MGSLVYSTRQRHNMKVFLFLSLCAALAQAATTPSSLTEEQEKLVSQLEDQELAKEVEGIISGMDEEQLARLEEVLTRKLKAQKAAASVPKFEPAAPKPETDIVGEILERRRRAVRLKDVRNRFYTFLIDKLAKIKPG